MTTALIEFGAYRAARIAERDRMVRALSALAALPETVIAEAPDIVAIIAREALQQPLSDPARAMTP